MVALIAFKWLRLLPSKLGLRPLWTLDWLITLGTLTVAMVAAGMINRFVSGPGSEKLSMSWLFQLPVPIRVWLAVTAGVCEEFLFRGFGISVLTRFAKNRWLAGLLSLLAFYRGACRTFPVNARTARSGCAWAIPDAPIPASGQPVQWSDRAHFN